jgi:hypothetical protein
MKTPKETQEQKTRMLMKIILANRIAKRGNANKEVKPPQQPDKQNK